MAEESVNAVIATSRCNACYLGASWGETQDFPMHLYSGGAPDKRFAIFTAEEEIRTSGAVDRSKWDQISIPIIDFIRKKHLGESIIAIEFDHIPFEDYMAIQEIFPKMKFVNATRLLLEARMVKTKPEMALIRHVVNIASKAHHAVLGIAENGIKMGEIVDTIYNVYVKENAQSAGRFQLSEILLFHLETVC